MSEAGQGRTARVEVREEAPGDRNAVRALNRAAFGGPEEADIVDCLRGTPAEVVSLVATVEGELVGHILFSTVSFERAEPDVRGAGLAPMAVLPAHQRAGIGAALVREGLDRCRRRGVNLVVVLGHPEYYPRFGFVPASRFGLRCEYDAPEEAFMVLELTPGAADRAAGLVRYHPAFGPG